MCGNEINQLAAWAALPTNKPFLAQLATNHVYGLTRHNVQRGSDLVVIPSREGRKKLQHALAMAHDITPLKIPVEYPQRRACFNS
jgi:hypothetical protein